MADLYLIFFGVGALLFAAIVGYSVLQKRKAQPVEKKDYVDPLFAELEQSKSKPVAAQESVKTSAPAKAENKAAIKASELSKAKESEPQSAPTKTQTESPVSRKAPSSKHGC